MTIASASTAHGANSIRLIRDSVHADKILVAICSDSLRDSFTTALIFSNVCVFIALLFAIDGLDVRTTIAYGVTAIGVLLSLGIVLAHVLQSNIAVHRKVRVVEAAGIVQDSVIAFSLIFDLFAVEQTYPNSAIGWMAMAAFLTLPLSSKFLTSMIAGRSVIFCVCILYILLTPDREFPDIVLVAPLIMAYCISVAMGYWLFIRYIQQLHTRIDIQEIHMLTTRQNVALEEARNRAEQSSAIQKKLYRYIGHDLRQPINAIDYMLYDLQRSSLTHGMQEVVEEARVCIRSANELIEDMLILSRYDVSEIEPKIDGIAIGDLIEEVVREFQASAKRGAGSLKRVPTTLMALGDPLLCRRVLRNFVGNAIRHAPGARILVGARRRAHQIAIQVIDDGPGIPRELVDKVFNPFVRGEPTDAHHGDGFGLGLTISRDLAQAMGGAVAVRSAVGRGASFELQLPTLDRVSLLRAPLTG